MYFALKNECILGWQNWVNERKGKQMYEGEIIQNELDI